jgi:NAD+ kinase
VCAYKADGLIVSTPHGIHRLFAFRRRADHLPSVPTICLTPICPHMLTYRPVLVPETSEVEVRCHGEDASVYLTIDGQIGEPLKKDDCVVCRSSQYALHLIRPPRMMFFDVLRQKLKWGER